jgi:hypothetical protein
MDSSDSEPSTQQPDAGFYPEPGESNLHPHALFFKVRFNIILPSSPVLVILSSHPRLS